MEWCRHFNEDLLGVSSDYLLHHDQHRHSTYLYSYFSQVVDAITKEDLSSGFGLNSSDSIRQKGASDFGSEVLEYTCTASQLNRLSEKALREASEDCIVYLFESNVKLESGSWPLLVALSGTEMQRVSAKALVELSLAVTSASDQQGPSFVPEGAVEAAFRKNSAMEDHVLAFEVPAVVVESPRWVQDEVGGIQRMCGAGNS